MEFGHSHVLSGQILHFCGNRLWLFVSQTLKSDTAIQIETDDSLLFCEIQHCTLNPLALVVEYLAEVIVQHTITHAQLNALRRTV
jgi:hypothetical protein